MNFCLLGLRKVFERLEMDDEQCNDLVVDTLESKF